MSLHFNILTLFPEMFPGSLGLSLSGKALERGDWGYTAVNIRDFAEGTHKSVDDTPYGGGAGMVMRPDVIEKAVLSVVQPSFRRKPESSSSEQEDPCLRRDDNEGCGDENEGCESERKIYLSPRGRPLTQALVQDLSKKQSVTLLCGRYEGVDQRVLDAYDFEEVSIGDYVLSGGEPAALILMDACIRLLPGVMGNDDTPLEESFSNGLLEYPHYTRPAEWTDAGGAVHGVPEVLQSGHHGNIKKWREEESLKLTRARRPDLLK